MLICAQKIEEISKSIFEYGEITAEIDIFSNLDLIAYENQHIRPILTTDNDFEIKQGKYPIISKILEEKGGVFVANDAL